MAQQILSGIGSLRPINAETYTMQTYNFLRAAILRRELKEGEVYSQDQILYECALAFANFGKAAYDYKVN